MLARNCFNLTWNVKQVDQGNIINYRPKIKIQFTPKLIILPTASLNLIEFNIN